MFGVEATADKMRASTTFNEVRFKLLNFRTSRRCRCDRSHTIQSLVLQCDAIALRVTSLNHFVAPIIPKFEPLAVCFTRCYA